MHDFQYKNNTLYCEDLPVATVAEAVGTPFYLYSAATLTRHFTAFDRAFASIPHLTCFAVKSCANIAILRLFANLGGGADIVSEGELFRARAAGIDPQKIVYSGVGKTAVEIRAALKAGILMLNVESEQELAVIQTEAAALGLKAPVSFRVNPDVDPRTHAYISTGLAKNKFGLPIDQAVEIYVEAKAMAHIEVVGVSCHIGSQLTTVEPFVESINKVIAFVKRLATVGIRIKYLDMGGGLGIRYDQEEPPLPADYAAALKGALRELPGCTLIIEPGRVIVGNAGILVTKVLYTKSGTKQFIIVDAGMNDLAQPVRGLPRHPAGGGAWSGRGGGRSGGSDLRDRRFPGQGSSPAGLCLRRSAGGDERRGLRLFDVVELQLPAAGGRGPGARGAPA